MGESICVSDSAHGADLGGAVVDIACPSVVTPAVICAPWCPELPKALTSGIVLRLLLGGLIVDSSTKDFGKLWEVGEWRAGLFQGGTAVDL